MASLKMFRALDSLDIDIGKTWSLYGQKVAPSWCYTLNIAWSMLSSLENFRASANLEVELG